MSGKKFTAAAAKVDQAKVYDVPQAVALVKSAAFAKFNETVEVALRLGVDPKHADQMVRGTVVLPHGLGKTTRVAVVASGEKIKEAELAGADLVGGDDLVAKIQAGMLDFEALVATPDMMKSLGRLGKVLGPKGLMPNPKAGTVTFDVGKAVTELKAGKIEFRVDKTAIIHVPVGKVQFGEKQLVENTEALLTAVQKARPATAKGKYMRSVVSRRRWAPASRWIPRSPRSSSGREPDMTATRAAKTEELQQLQGTVGKAAHAFLIDYKGLTVPAVTDLRRQIQAASSDYVVVKNTLAMRALEGKPLGTLKEHFTGMTGVAYSHTDAVALAKVLHTFGKTNPHLKVKAALLDGKPVAAKELETLANLPSRLELVAGSSASCSRRFGGA